jgi:hypothetical protein
VNLSVSGTTTLSGLTASTALALDASKNVVSVTNTGTDNNVLATSPTITTPRVVTSLNDTNGNEVFGITATGSAVNELTIANAATAANPVISATGSDTNIGITLTPKGTGNAVLTSGNLVVANGNGIDFSATAGTGTSELLADYEEGTWTPTITGSTTNPTVTYDLQRGTYTKIGRVVTVSCFLSWTAISGGSGDARISGLPFTVESNPGANGAGAISQFDGFTLASLRTSASMFTPNVSTFLTVRCFGSTVTTQTVAISGLAASGSLVFTATYAV